MAYALFDIGGTKTRVAISQDLKSFSEKIKFDTPEKFTDGVEAVHEAIASLTSDPIEALAGGIRGPLNGDKTGIIREDVLTDWVEQPLALALGKPYKAPVFLENDTATVGLGEAHFGAGREGKIVVYHTVSTGVGGIKIENGYLDQASIGFEPGHQILDIDSSVFGDKTIHTLENLVSGSALEKRRGVKPYEIPQSDPVWPELAGYLAKGLRNTIVYWSPDTIVLGGSMIIGDPRIMLEDIKRETAKMVEGLVPCPKILDATLSDEGGLYGAMVLIEQRMQ
jgi:predicted NBD/HSP70 family sugar kinase